MKSKLYFLLLLLTTLLSPAFGSTATGSIHGKVSDENGRPLPYASVALKGTSWGASSGADGTFGILHVPIGRYAVVISIMGYATQTMEIDVRADESARIEARLEEKPSELEEVQVVASKRFKLNIGGESDHSKNQADFKNLPVEDPTGLVLLNPSVVVHAGEINIRGGRSDEAATLIDGVSVTDPQRGGEGSLATRGIEAVEVRLGGLGAQYGSNLSGVIEYQTKEGGQEPHGELYYVTDRYGSPAETFTNLQRVYAGFGGPISRSLTYYLGGEGAFSDGSPSSPADHNRRRLLNFIPIGDRNNNRLKWQSKLVARPGVRDKLTFEAIADYSRSFPYLHMWSRPGYVKTIRDTTQTGEIQVRHGGWSPSPLDSSYEYYNPADHTPMLKNDFSMRQFTWRHTLGASSYFTLKAARNRFYRDQRVQGKQAWEYEGDRANDYWHDYANNSTSPFFVISGDYPLLQNEETIVSSVMGDGTFQWKAHTFQSGVSLNYNDMRFYEVVNPFLTGTNGVIGSETRYHVYSPDGAAYTQYRWQHEGMVLNLGLRYDVLNIGQQLNSAQVRDRTRSQVSPRVGVAYPITDKDVFSFHYGRLYKEPLRQYLYADASVTDGRTRGNPNLQNETTATYQMAVEHLFSDIVMAQFAIYYKDVYGLITSEDEAMIGTVGLVPKWVNLDYASARGFEVSLRREFANSFGAEVNYTYGVATGTGSDPSARQTQNFVYLPISEQPLDWDVRHNLTCSLQMADADVWSCSLIWTFTSGVPYTPRIRSTRQVDPADVNSRRLPSSTTLAVQVQKRYGIWGQRFNVFMEASNLLDAKNIANLFPGNFPTPPGGTAADYIAYYTETGRAGGAYLGEDRNGDGIVDWVPLQDPRVFDPPRAIKAGLSFDF